MEQKEKSPCKIGRVVVKSLRWLCFILLEMVITVFNLLIIFSIYYYCSYCFGSKEHIEPDQQTVSIKKVDGFYLIQGKEYGYFHERTFPDCKIKFYNKELTFKKGDVFDGDKCVTDKVAIEWTDVGYRVYYLKRSYPLTTLTKFDGSYKTRYNSIKEGKDMYANGGRFYVDVDERHEFFNFVILVIALIFIIGIRKALVEITNDRFDDEYSLTIGRLYDLPDLFKKKDKEEE